MISPSKFLPGKQSLWSVHPDVEVSVIVCPLSHCPSFAESTTVQLIQRFYDPDHGQILLDGIDLKALNVCWLRSQMGIVSQEPVLFTGSIEENIRMGKPDATDEEVRNAAKIANAHEFIMALPEVPVYFPCSYIVWGFFSRTELQDKFRREIEWWAEATR